MSVKLSVILGVWFLLCSSLSVGAQEKADQPRNVELTNAAWAAYKSHDFPAAITAADRCIVRFKAQADVDQEQLKRHHAPLPPTGKVTEDQKNDIRAGRVKRRRDLLLD